MTDWREQYKPDALVEVRHTHTVGGENEWSRIRVLSAGEDRYDGYTQKKIRKVTTP